MSLGLMMNTAVYASALQLGMWWWFIPPGIGITAIVGGLYVMNVGLDEIFNPRLRDTMSLAVDDLRVYYRSLRGDVKAVDGVTLRVADGEIMGLAGESGCGKTTLGKSLIRLDGAHAPRRAAAVELDGDELPIGNDRAMDAFRFQRGLDRPAVRDERAQPDPEDRADDRRSSSRHAASSYEQALPELKRRLELVGLADDVLGLLPDRALGRDEAARRDGALVAPRPVAPRSPTRSRRRSTSRAQRAVTEMLVEFRDRGFVKSMIVITHDLSVLYQIADTILVMYAGKLAEKAPAETIVDAPRHPYTQLLLSSLPEVGVTLRREEARAGFPAGRRRSSNPPTGCRFRDRCPLAFEECLEEPPFVEVEPDHVVACWKA